MILIGFKFRLYVIFPTKYNYLIFLSKVPYLFIYHIKNHLNNCRLIDIKNMKKYENINLNCTKNLYFFLFLHFLIYSVSWYSLL